MDVFVLFAKELIIFRYLHGVETCSKSKLTLAKKRHAIMTFRQRLWHRAPESKRIYQKQEYCQGWSTSHAKL